MKNAILSLFIIIVLTITCPAQTTSTSALKNEDIERVRAEEVVAQYHKAIGLKKINPSQMITVNKDGKSTNTIYYFSDYKDFSGTKLATKIEKFENNELANTKIVNSFDTNPTFPANFFELK